MLDGRSGQECAIQHFFCGMWCMVQEVDINTACYVSPAGKGKGGLCCEGKIISKTYLREVQSN